jgi:hypothetical protein
MPTLKGREAEQRRRDQVPEKIKRILRGAARAGATVIADEAKERVESDAVREGVVIGRTKEVDGKLTVRITVKPGWPRSLGTWLEYGTSPHFISVDPAFSEGRTAQRVNKLDADAAKGGQAGPGATLVINGKPVGMTVLHPGARAQPWLRPARDVKAREAVAAAQGHIDASMRRSGHKPTGSGS